MKNDLLTALRKELESSFGRKIVSSRDCLQMVDDIYQKTGYSINANTLRRFFGLVQTNYSASPSTLNILSRYCGFNSIDDLHNLSTTRPAGDQVPKEEVHRYLVSLIRNLPVTETSPMVYNAIIQQTVHFLDRNISLVERFQREIAATPAGQYFYFERSVNMDRLNGYYGEGLRYYLRAKNNNEAKVFVYAIQVFRHWLSNEDEQTEKFMSLLSGIPMTVNYPPHILARSIAARLYYANFRNEIPDRILQDAAKYYISLKAKTDNPDPEFDLIIGEALILTNHLSEGLEYIRRGRSNQSPTRNSGYEPLFAFWEKFAGGRKNSSTKIIINPSRVNRGLIVYSPLYKKYLGLLTMATDHRAKKTNLAELARETGFIRLSY